MYMCVSKCNRADSYVHVQNTESGYEKHMDFLLILSLSLVVRALISMHKLNIHTHKYFVILHVRTCCSFPCE